MIQSPLLTKPSVHHSSFQRSHVKVLHTAGSEVCKSLTTHLLGALPGSKDPICNYHQALDHKTLCR